MTKKDFELIAAALYDARPACGPESSAAEYLAQLDQHVRAVTLLANRLRESNPRFDRTRFLSFAGVQP